MHTCLSSTTVQSAAKQFCVGVQGPLQATVREAKQCAPYWGVEGLACSSVPLQQRLSDYYYWRLMEAKSTSVWPRAEVHFSCMQP